MAEETQVQNAGQAKRKRIGYSKGHKGGKKPKVYKGSGNKVKVDGKMKKLFRKRARDYNSDDEDAEKNFEKREERISIKEVMNYERDDDELNSQNDGEDQSQFSEDEHDDIQTGITKFVEGCRAFKLAFKKIMKRSISDNSLGPVLSGHQKLVAEKLAEEDAVRKVKGEAKKEKHIAQEKGHIIPENFLDVHEKFLIGVARKGVVKLFNAVNKAQMAQKGLNPSRTKDAKELSKKRKDAFFSELGRKPFTSSKLDKSKEEEEGPAWAPLRDNYMLTNSKLKNWDKQDKATTDDSGRAINESSDDE